jgi:cytochrome P450
MDFLTNLVLIPWRGLKALLGGFADLYGLLRLLLPALAAGGGTLKSRLLERLTSIEGQRLVLGVLRVFWANLVIGKPLVKSYPNSGTVLVTRFVDVCEVLNREAHFAVVYEPRMRRITDGANFFLGMQDSAEYQHDVSIMRLAARREDVAAIIVPFVAERAEAVVAGAGDRIDVPAVLTLPVIAQMTGRYFGTPGPGEADSREQALIEWTSIMFWYLFNDLGADPAVEARAMAAADACRSYLDRCIAERKATPTADEDVLDRCLDLQRAGTLGFDDRAIRDNLIGLIIGAIPTLSKAAVQALDQLLDRPDQLAAAQEAARRGDDETLGRVLLEALRFNPVNPVIYRRALKDTSIAAGTLRARRIPQGSMVFAANLAAMFDPWRLEEPKRFRTDRPWDHYILWGLGLHTCFGAHINRAGIPVLLRPLLARGSLKRVEGIGGRIDTGGTPFPAHFSVEIGPG